MRRRRGLIIIIIFFFQAFIVLGNEASNDRKYLCNDINNPSPCRNLLNISYPFRLNTDPPDCGGDSRYELSCENNRTILHLDSGEYHVEAISYENQSMRVVDSGLQIHNCSSLPLHPLTFLNLTFDNSTKYVSDRPYFLRAQTFITFLSCETPIFSGAIIYPDNFVINTFPCINGSSGSYSYVLVGDLPCSQVPDLCTIGTSVPIRQLEYEAGHYPSFSGIHREMAMGFELSWSHEDMLGVFCVSEVDRFNNTIRRCYYSCIGNRASFRSYFSCFWNYYWPLFYEFGIPKILGPVMLLRISVGIICFCTLLIYMLRRRHFSMDTNIEEFLQEHNNLMLVQYSYSEIKKMTKHFSDKLGQGGFGLVYKGKLRSGNLVAIKMLTKSKGNGKDFINEIATIGRIHHVNVVRLIGFCFERSKRALVYDFMPNGSLDKFIFIQEQTEIFLSWENMYKIALGIAHGIEYLHRGCAMQILHFDIKPHNVLLDEDFTPKISDFGLAKLYLTTDNTVSLTAARGTIGYIAPELVYKSMGGVSYKADVYSFGMLLMEMAGRRKNVNPFANTTSQVYFPSWVYEKLSRGEDMEMEDATDEDKSTIRKMIIVALSCIQLKPDDRPSMSRVIEMLESPTELLQMPPRPFLGSSLERMTDDQTIIEPSATSLQSSSSSNYSVIQSNYM